VPDILDMIVQRRTEDYKRLGPQFGCAVPPRRTRPVVPFLASPGTILEVKRASPSKGDIAVDLDPVSIVAQYRAAGTKNVSVLTESNFFKGSLNDLVAVSTGNNELSFLRKDFILYEDELEVSFRAGADAVLCIARILDRSMLLRLVAACRAFGMTPFIEVRDEDDVRKLQAAATVGTVVAGVNSRDLATFRLDPLVPATLRTSLPCKTVFESGAATPGACRFARQLGFDGLLIGEAATRAPEKAGELVSAFMSARPDWVGQFWREIGRRALGRTRPLVKVCGLTSLGDALAACDLGADILGFVFAPSPRAADPFAVRMINDSLAQRRRATGSAAFDRPLLVAVIVDPDSVQAAQAFALVRDGVIDVVQYHGEIPVHDLPRIDAAAGNFGIGRYAVVRLGGEADLQRIDTLVRNGEPRVLVDARVEGIAGGTGKTIPSFLVSKAAERCPLWLAGGLNPQNVRAYINEFDPELIDVSSGIEAMPGRKDHERMKSFFREVCR